MSKTKGCFILFLLLALFRSDPTFAVDNQSVPRLSELFRYGDVRKDESHYRIGERSGVFLKLSIQNQVSCLVLDKPGSYSISGLSGKLPRSGKVSEFIQCNLRALAHRLATPADMIVIPDPRGPEFDDDPENLFERTWEQVVLKATDDLPAENLLASAFWFFERKNNPARSAYILETLHQRTDDPWILDLHHDAYRASSPSWIQSEVEQTKNRLASAFNPESNVALLIGIENYSPDSRWQPLKTPVNDINRLKKILVEKYSFNPARIQVLPDATYQQMLDAIAILRRQVTERSNLLVYYAGHGWVDEDGDYFWIPVDGQSSPRTWIYTDYILNKIKALGSLHTLLVVDSCFGGALNNHETRGDISGGIRKLYEKRSRQLITAGGLEPVFDGGGSGNSVFAEAFLDILDKQQEDRPLGVHELFTRLRPVVVSRSNQTPTYDRIPGSQDEWGEFYFMKNWQKPQLTAAVPETAEKTGSDSGESLPGELIEELQLSKPGSEDNTVANLWFIRSDSVIRMGDILENELFSDLGAGLSFTIKFKDHPLFLQAAYATTNKEAVDSVTHENQNYHVPQTLNKTDLRLGVRKTVERVEDQRFFESGIYYHWKRFQLKWDTEGISNIDSDSEYIHIGYHLLDVAYFNGWRWNQFVDLGFHYDFKLGIANLSGSTAIAGNEKYNKDTSNLVLGLGFIPEIRIRFPLVTMDLRLGGGFDYLWQPVDDEGGASSGENSINVTRTTSIFYAILNLGF